MKKLYGRNKKTNEIVLLKEDTQENLEILKSKIEAIPQGLAKYDNLEITN